MVIVGNGNVNLPQTYTMKLFVAGLPPDFDETDLKEMFELYGEVASAKLIIDRETGKSKGFGFIEMPDNTDAKETIEALHNIGIRGGKKISVQEAEEKPRNPNPGFNRNKGFGGNSRY